MANLPKITGRLLQYGKPAKTPVALIRWGTTPEQKTLVGTLGDISAKAVQAGFKSPAVIVVGEVVAMREKLNWFENKPFFGKRVLVTRAREQASRLSEMIHALGGEPVEYPTIRVAEPDDYAAMDEAIKEIESYGWIIFTSVNGVASFFKRLRYHHQDVRRLHQARICAIGPKTREALENYGLLVETVPGEYLAEEIVEELQGKIAVGDRVLLPRAAAARRVLPEALTAMGAVVTEVPAYRTITGGGDTDLVAAMLQRKEIQVITFTSSSTAQNFVKMLNAANMNTLLKGVTVACIGPVTADTARGLGIKVDVVAGEYTIEGLVKSIQDYFSCGPD
jgi:uroporphyrinogen III methyltransferase/synthase